MLKIGNIEIDTPVSLAPMAGVTNWPFRLLCKEQGCGFVVTEFVNDKALLFDSRRTYEMIELKDGERPAGIQIFGADPDTMAAAAVKVAEAERPGFVDINMGCPAPKITKGRGGSSLLREPELAQNIVRAVVRAVSPLPVTVKIRIGWDTTSINAVEVAKRVEDAGAVMLTVHGRTREQHYSGQADWAVIDAVARSVSIPVIGNGDVTTPEIAKHRLETTAVAGVAIGRGAMGNPWIFQRIKHYLQTGEIIPDLGADVRVSTALRHLNLMTEYRDEYIAVREMRKHAAWYLKGLRGAAYARNAINTCESAEEMRDILGRFLDRYQAGDLEATPADDMVKGGIDDPTLRCDTFVEKESV